MKTTGKRINRGKLFLSFAILILFVLSGCNQLFSPSSLDESLYPSGMGSFSLHISDENIRTILPGTVQSDFTAYRLTFSGSANITENRTSANYSSPVYLPIGTYNLTVTAYLDTGMTKPAAQGSASGITIGAGGAASRSITLSAIIGAGAGPGTFSWNVNFPGTVNAAAMKITPVNPATGTAETTVNLLGVTAPNVKNSSLTLNSGYYKVLFTLTMPGTKTLEWLEALHIYQNLESHCERDFANEYFNNNLYTVTFDYNYDNLQGQQSVLHGNTVNALTPSRFGYVFSGWFSDAGCTVPYIFSTTVINSFTLYAKWITVPSAPQNFMAMPGWEQVTLSWFAPSSDGGSVITGYQVSNNNGSTWSAASSNTSHTFTGLTNGNSYIFNVRAVNSAGNGEEASISVNMPTWEYADYVKRVTFTGQTETVNFSNLYSNDIYLVKVNTSTGVVISGNTGGYVSSIFRNSLLPNRQTLGFEQEQPIKGRPDAVRDNAMRPVSAFIDYSDKSLSFIPYNVGDKKLFWTDDYTDSFEQREATLLAQGTHSNIWVFGDSITSSQADQLAEKFDIIYPVTTNIFGYEYGSEPNAIQPGGRDGDPRIQILVYYQISYIGGYFWSKDYYSGPYSNNAEIFYINGRWMTGNRDFIYSALVHELQHMIHWNMKSVRLNTSSPTWYNEMLSMVAEDIVASHIGITPANNDHVINQRMWDFLFSYDVEGITEWQQNYASYATKYFFGAYLLRNYGGADLIKEIMANNTVGIPSLTSALQPRGASFDEAFRRYGEALVYSGSLMPAGVNTFDKTVTTTTGSYTYTSHGFNIWTKNNYITGMGPYVWPINAHDDMRPHSLVLIQDNGWKNKTGSYSITLDKPNDPNIELYLMVK